ncbi:MAG TPA: cold shock domain-containing protein CspD [Pseudomonas sp.]|uniref:cold shock domain-containing protein CspD n=1 Tax=Pseudomonas sp. TaxID=306 RepID=UPI002B4665DE|nr:cold shock domain-containing protein CspD [Pseudomonas sp.]HKS12223.1 cold shock domain-containing protein CspD [Pseudomonas sp.]
MASGKVKWFNNAKGYGFVNEEGKTEDLFAHYSAIQMDGYKTLKAGQVVTFDIIQGPKGLHAVNIVDPARVEAAHVTVSTPEEQAVKA